MIKQHAGIHLVAFICIVGIGTIALNLLCNYFIGGVYMAITTMYAKQTIGSIFSAEKL